MLGSAASGQTSPFSSPFALSGQTKAAPKRLSCVPEEQSVYARIYYTVIGPGSWQLAEDIVDTAKEVYPTLQSKNRWSTRDAPSVDSIEGLADTVDDGIVDEDPPFTYKVWLNEDEQKATGSKWAQPRDDPEEHQSRVFAIMKTLSAASRSTTSLGESMRKSFSRISTVHAEPAKKEKQVAALNYFCIEKESEEMKQCRSLERWKYSCVLFMVDPRQEEEDQDFLSELARRQQEVQKWATQHVQRHSLDSTPPLIAVVMINGSNQSEYQSYPSSRKSEDSHSLESKGENGDAPAGSIEHDKYMAFVDDIRSMLKIPEGECIHRFVNFDDPAEVMKCHVTLAASIVDERKKHAEQALLKDHSRLDSPITKTKQASCCKCSVM